MRTESDRTHRPFWIPPAHYYVLAVAVSVAFFFLVWGLLSDEGAENPWITAGLGASILLSGAVILREIVLRRAQKKLLAQERILSNKSRRVVGQTPPSSSHQYKLTLEQHAAILKDIKQKSDAANVLNRFSAGHREVFELCEEYLARNEDELKRVSAGSPRLTALLKGRSMIGDCHRYHLLKWAEIESTTLAEESWTRPTAGEREAFAERAVGVVKAALEVYPAEPSLGQSIEVLEELVVSVQVTNLIEAAERAVSERDYPEALGIYEEALFRLGSDAIGTSAREQAAVRINAAIERIHSLETGK